MKNSHKPLNSRQKLALRTIMNCMLKFGRFPSTVMLAEGMGVSSPGTAKHYLEVLTIKGYLLHARQGYYAVAKDPNGDPVKLVFLRPGEFIARTATEAFFSGHPG